MVTKENLHDWLSEKGVRWLLLHKYGHMSMESETKDDLLSTLYEKHDANPIMMPLVDPSLDPVERDTYFTEDGKKTYCMYTGG